jgi:hypothetical protein
VDKTSDTSKEDVPIVLSVETCSVEIPVLVRLSRTESGRDVSAVLVVVVFEQQGVLVVITRSTQLGRRSGRGVLTFCVVRIKQFSHTEITAVAKAHCRGQHSVGGGTCRPVQARAN